MSRKIVVSGIGPFSRMICSLFADSGADTVVRTAHQRFIPQDEQGDLPFVPFETLAQSHPPHEYEVFIALAHARQNKQCAPRSPQLPDSRDIDLLLMSVLR
jgi:hypothetical protein